MKTKGFQLKPVLTTVVGAHAAAGTLQAAAAQTSCSSWSIASSAAGASSAVENHVHGAPLQLAWPPTGGQPQPPQRGQPAASHGLPDRLAQGESRAVPP